MNVPTDDGGSDSVDYRHAEKWQLERIERLRARAVSGSGGGGGMDGWQHSVESRLSGLESQVLDLREELRGLRTDVRADMKELRSELGGDITDARSEVKADIRDVRVEIRWIAGLLVTFLIGLLGVMAKGSAGSEAAPGDKARVSFEARPGAA